VNGSASRRRASFAAVIFAAAALAACVEGEGVPPGKVAVVGDVVLGPEDIAAIKAQLGAYAQLRFAGQEGRAALVESVVAAELLAQEAIDAGLGDDPRVEWAVLEEIAEVQLAAELERRVPRQSVADDTAALRAYYDAHLDEFTTPERRNLEGVYFETAKDAEQALADLVAGRTTLGALGEVVSTPLQTRDDAEHPGFHVLLFDPSLSVGDWVAAPVLIGTVLVTGRVQQIIAPTPEPFDDPAVQERLVQAVRAPRLEQARAALLAELATRYPEQTP